MASLTLSGYLVWRESLEFVLRLAVGILLLNGLSLLFYVLFHIPPSARVRIKQAIARQLLFWVPFLVVFVAVTPLLGWNDWINAAIFAGFLSTSGLWIDIHLNRRHRRNVKAA